MKSRPLLPDKLSSLMLLAPPEDPPMTIARDHGLTDEELRMLEGVLTKLSGRGAELPEPLFRFMIEITAKTNIDLLVQDTEKQVLLAWRDDPFGTGWHVPGSIIRHREGITHRIQACADEEFGCEMEWPIARSPSSRSLTTGPFHFVLLLDGAA